MTARFVCVVWVTTELFRLCRYITCVNQAFAHLFSLFSFKFTIKVLISALTYIFLEKFKTEFWINLEWLITCLLNLVPKAHAFW